MIFWLMIFMSVSRFVIINRPPTRLAGSVNSARPADHGRWSTVAVRGRVAEPADHVFRSPDSAGSATMAGRDWFKTVLYNPEQNWSRFFRLYSSRHIPTEGRKNNPLVSPKERAFMEPENTSPLRRAASYRVRFQPVRPFRECRVS
jgi:hypothetical protein